MVPSIIHSFLVTGPICSSLLVAMTGASGVCFVSGGKILYTINGVTRSDAIAGKLAALNQVIHLTGTLTPRLSANLIHNRFWAAAVRKRALELLDDCQASTTKTYNIVNT